MQHSTGCRMSYTARAVNENISSKHKLFCQDPIFTRRDCCKICLFAFCSIFCWFVATFLWQICKYIQKRHICRELANTRITLLFKDIFSTTRVSQLLPLFGNIQFVWSCTVFVMTIIYDYSLVVLSVLLSYSGQSWSHHSQDHKDEVFRFHWSHK